MISIYWTDIPLPSTDGILNIYIYSRLTELWSLPRPAQGLNTTTTTTTTNNNNNNIILHKMPFILYCYRLGSWTIHIVHTRCPLTVQITNQILMTKGSRKVLPLGK